MPNKIKPKRSYTANSVPLTTDLEAHELAIRWTAENPAMFTKDASGNIVSVTLGGSGGGSSSANIVEATTAAGFPATGASSTLYVATDASRVYRWTGSVYIEIGTAGGGGTDSVLRALFVPPAPTSVTAGGFDGQAVVQWTAPTVLSQTPITDYTLQFRQGSGDWTTFTRSASTATSATVTGLSNGSAYTFRVAAVNGVGTGAYSAASSSVTPNSGVAVTYLLVGGGGGGGDGRGGGGGAGGYLYGSGIAALASSLSVVVGAGGSNSTNGENSTFVLSSGSLTALGGGGGADGLKGLFTGSGEAGGSGGSGGGGSGYPPVGDGGSGSQGYAGGSGYGLGEPYNGGSGGGAGGAGSTGYTAPGGSGRSNESDFLAAANAGVDVSGIRYIAAGGSGGSYGPTPGSGGVGGGGAGGNSGAQGSSGAAFTGSGGGGGGNGANGGYGGSGVVILRIPTTHTATTTGSPDIYVTGGYRYYKFTQNGTIQFSVA
jgi:hypothetical protein